MIACDPTRVSLTWVLMLRGAAFGGTRWFLASHAIPSQHHPTCEAVEDVALAAAAGATSLPATWRRASERRLLAVRDRAVTSRLGAVRTRHIGRRTDSLV